MGGEGYDDASEGEGDGDGEGDAEPGEAVRADDMLVGLCDRGWRSVCGVLGVKLTITGAATGSCTSFPSPIPGVTISG